MIKVAERRFVNIYKTGRDRTISIKDYPDYESARNGANDVSTYEETVEIVSGDYAKQEAIEFVKFLNANYWEQDDDGYWYKWCLRTDSDERKSDQEIFDIFLQSKTNQL